MYITNDKINLIKLELENKLEALKLAPKIKEIIKTFEGKTFSKRIETKLKEINENLSFKIDNNDFLQLTFYFENRGFQNEAKTHWVYIKHSSETIFCELVKGLINEEFKNGLKEDKKIDSEFIIKKIEWWEEYTTKSIKEATQELYNLEELKKDYNNYIEAKNKLANHHHTIKHYFEINI